MDRRFEESRKFYAEKARRAYPKRNWSEDPENDFYEPV